MGTGIKYLSHVTLETPRIIERADIVLYGVADPATAIWIRELNPNAEPFCDYVPGAPRRVTYEKWVDRILECVRDGQRVCATFYGHPGAFVYSSHEAIRRARAEGFEARMLPGISAEDCLFADLGVDPFVAGCQSFEATDFLVRPRNFDTSTALILWQLATIGRLDANASPNPTGVAVLADFLGRRYGDEHQVVVYRSATLSLFQCSIRAMSLAEMGEAVFDEPATLYVPPKESPPIAHEMVQRLGIPREHLDALDPRWGTRE